MVPKHQSKAKAAAKLPARKKVMAKPTLPNIASWGKETHLSPAELSFDFLNPRFYGRILKTEEEVIDRLWKETDLREVVQSILASGYIDFEPLIVLERDSNLDLKNVVLEGNRRLAAIRILTNRALCREYGLEEDIPEKIRIQKLLRVFIVKSREIARAYIGFKHINGPQKWDALAKAKFAAEWYETKVDIETISKTLGDTHHTVRRLINGWFVLEQAKQNGFDLGDISATKFPFSHLYTAITRENIRKYIGIIEEEQTGPPKANPVPKSHLKQLMTLMSWLYGQQKNNEPAIILSQNPNLNELNDVLGERVASEALFSKRNLKMAYQLIVPPTKRFGEALVQAYQNAEQALGLAPSYDGKDETLLRLAVRLKKTSIALHKAMNDASGDVDVEEDEG